MISLSIHAQFGGGEVCGDCAETALGQFLGRFTAEDVSAFAKGYFDHQRGQRVALVQPKRVEATVKSQKPALAASRTVYVPVEAPKPLSRDAVWAKIVQAAGGDVPEKINAFMRTIEGNALYEQYLAAAPAPSPAPMRSQPEKGAIAQAIEQRARQEQLPGETLEAAIVRMCEKYPNLYRARVAEVRALR